MSVQLPRVEGDDVCLVMLTSKETRGVSFRRYDAHSMAEYVVWVLRQMTSTHEADLALLRALGQGDEKPFKDWQGEAYRDAMKAIAMREPKGEG